MNSRLAVVLTLTLASVAAAQETTPGHLLIIGGGGLDEDAVVFERLVQYAGGAQQARIAVIPTASLGTPSAEQFQRIMAHWKVPAEQVHLIPLTSTNAKEAAFDPKLVAQLQACNGIFFQGGDQNRLMGALVQDGEETPVLAAIRQVWQRGGVIAGSSAGAAVQSATMISVAGLPRDTFDEGLDALDFGVTQNVARRGLLATKGLGFFQGGIIDQHFNQYRGRLGRLARAVIEGEVRYGFGIDERTALDVAPDGSFEVLGDGIVMVLDLHKATCIDGPLGCRMTNICLSCLKAYDRFDPATNVMTIDPAKVAATPGNEAFNGNFVVPDIAARGAVVTALYMGLADNTSRKQVGITLKHHGHTAHGYRYTFQKTAETKYLEGEVRGQSTDSLLNVQLDIEPIDGLLKAPDFRLPSDLPELAAERASLTALWRRGMLQEDDAQRLRPHDPITRAELAGLIAGTLRLELPRRASALPSDIGESAWSDAIALVVGNRLLDVDAANAFRPHDPITREAAASVLVQLAERYQQQPLPSADESVLPADDLDQLDPAHRLAAATMLQQELMTAKRDGFLPKQPLTRLEAATAVYAIIGFRWATAVATPLATPSESPPMLGQQP